ncbi:MAG: hypothetical protein LBC21_01285 [Oscillospiraceae bacterium]|jgi:CobQ-like glutamine amidotransferase family enzyme|nr:hypothetical protein [Oscillospiraceae bacterium]
MVIEILFPELCCLYGDAANAELLLRSVPGAQAERTPPRRRPAFLDRDVGLVYMGSMTERGQQMALSALAPYRDEIERRVDGGARVLVTGNAVEIFGKYIDCGDGTRIDGLGMFDIYAKRDMAHRYNGLFLGKYGQTEIVGFASRFSHMYDIAGDDAGALFKTVRGAGRSPGDSREGLRRGNFMATYVLGPLLILNPPFTRMLLRDMGEPGAAPPFEYAAMEAYEARLREFKNPKTGFEY